MTDFIGRRAAILREILDAEERILAAMAGETYAECDRDRQRVVVARVKLELLDEGDGQDNGDDDE